MTKKLCDCCFDEITDSLCQGYLRIPIAFYEYLVGNNPNMKQRIDKPKDSFMMFFDTGPSTIDLDICGSCLRQIVNLRERMMEAVKDGMLR
jgi:hypothetical protein